MNVDHEMAVLQTPIKANEYILRLYKFGKFLFGPGNKQIWSWRFGGHIKHAIHQIIPTITFRFLW